MFERLVSDALNRVLGKYVENVDPKALSLAVWQGDVQLQNVKLRADALDDLELPVRVTCGYIGSVRVQVPWRKLKKEAVNIVLDDVFVLASLPQADEQFEQYDASAVLRTKLQRLLNAEDAWQRTQKLALEKATVEEQTSKRGRSAEEEEEQSWTAKLLETIVANVQIKVNNLHMRLEADTSASTSASTMAFGLFLGHVAIKTVDDNGQDTFVVGGGNRMNKRLNLSGLLVYVSLTSPKLQISGSGDETASEKLPDELQRSKRNRKEEQADQKALEEQRWRNLLAPAAVDMSNRVLERADLSLDYVAYTDKHWTNMKDKAVASKAIEAVVDEVGIALSDAQYRSFFQLLELVSSAQRRIPHAHLRPRVRPSLSPREWWTYGWSATAHAMQHKRATHMRWPEVLAAMRARRRYVEVYKEGLNAGQTREKMKGKEVLDEIEAKYSLEVLLVFRCLARMQINLVAAQEAAEKRRRELEKQKAKSGFWSMFSSSRKDTKDELGMELMASSQSSATEREAQLIKPEDWSNLQKLFDEVKEEAEEGRKSAQELDPEQLQYRLCFKLKRFTLRLVKDESTFMNLTSLKWQLDLDVFDKAMQARVTAGAYSMEDSNGARLLQSYGVGGIAPSRDRLLSTPGEHPEPQSAVQNDESQDQSSFLFVYDASPFWEPNLSPTSRFPYLEERGPVRDVEGRVSCVVAPCRMLLYRSLLDEFAAFFAIDEDLSATGALVVSTAGEVGTQAASTIEGALQGVKERRFEVMLNLSAPQVALADGRQGSTASGRQSVIVVDLGSFVLCNVDAEAYQAPLGIHEKAVVQYCSNDKDSGGYESFCVQGQNTSVAVLSLPSEGSFCWNTVLGCSGTVGADCLDLHHCLRNFSDLVGGSMWKLLMETNMQAYLHVRREVRARLDQPMIVLSASLPSITISASADMLTTLLRVVFALMEEPENAKSSSLSWFERLEPNVDTLTVDALVLTKNRLTGRGQWLRKVVCIHNQYLHILETHTSRSPEKVISLLSPKVFSPVYLDVQASNTRGGAIPTEHSQKRVLVVHNSDAHVKRDQLVASLAQNVVLSCESDKALGSLENALEHAMWTAQMVKEATMSANERNSVFADHVSDLRDNLPATSEHQVSNSQPLTELFSMQSLMEVQSASLCIYDHGSTYDRDVQNFNEQQATEGEPAPESALGMIDDVNVAFGQMLDTEIPILTLITREMTMSAKSMDDLIAASFETSNLAILDNVLSRLSHKPEFFIQSGSWDKSVSKKTVKVDFRSKRIVDAESERAEVTLDFGFASARAWLFAPTVNAIESVSMRIVRNFEELFAAENPGSVPGPLVEKAAAQVTNMASRLGQGPGWADIVDVVQYDVDSNEKDYSGNLFFFNSFVVEEVEVNFLDNTRTFKEIRSMCNRHRGQSRGSNTIENTVRRLQEYSHPLMLAKFSLGRSKLALAGYEYKFGFVATFGGLHIVCDGHDLCHLPPGHEELAHFRFDVFQSSSGAPYDFDMFVRVQQVDLVYLASPVFAILDWFTDIGDDPTEIAVPGASLEAPVAITDASSQAGGKETTVTSGDEAINVDLSDSRLEAAVLKTKFRVDVKIIAPTLTVPSSVNNKEEAIRAHLGTITLSNKLVDTSGAFAIDQIDMLLSGVRLGICNEALSSAGDRASFDGADASTSWILKHLEAPLVLRRPVGDRVPASVPLLDIDVNIPAIQLRFNDTYIAAMVAVVTGNDSEGRASADSRFRRKRERDRLRLSLRNLKGMDYRISSAMGAEALALDIIDEEQATEPSLLPVAKPAPAERKRKVSFTSRGQRSEARRFVRASFRSELAEVVLLAVDSGDVAHPVARCSVINVNLAASVAIDLTDAHAFFALQQLQLRDERVYCHENLRSVLSNGEDDHVCLVSAQAWMSSHHCQSDATETALAPDTSSRSVPTVQLQAISATEMSTYFESAASISDQQKGRVGGFVEEEDLEREVGLVLRVHGPRLLLTPDFMQALVGFSYSSLSSAFQNDDLVLDAPPVDVPSGGSEGFVHMGTVGNAPDSSSRSRPSRPKHLNDQSSKHLSLSPSRRLLADCAPPGSVLIYDGKDGSIVIPPKLVNEKHHGKGKTPPSGSGTVEEPLIIIGDGVELRMRNVTIHNAHLLDAVTWLKGDSKLVVEEDSCTLIRRRGTTSRDAADKRSETTPRSPLAEALEGAQGKLAPPTKPLQWRWLCDVTVIRAKLAYAGGDEQLEAGADCHLVTIGRHRMVSAGVDTLVWLSSFGRRGFTEVLAPGQVSIDVVYTLPSDNVNDSEEGPAKEPKQVTKERTLNVDVKYLSDMHAKLNPSTIVAIGDLISRLDGVLAYEESRFVTQCRLFDAVQLSYDGLTASGLKMQGISVPEHPSATASALFRSTLVWSGEPTSISFWRPKPPPGYLSVGDVVTMDGKPPIAPVLVVRDVKSDQAMYPVAFEHLYLTESQTDVWVPVPPDGFASLGCFFGLEPPPLDSVACLRLDRLVYTNALNCLDSGHLWRVANQCGTVVFTRTPGIPRSGLWELRKPSSRTSHTDQQERSTDTAGSSDTLEGSEQVLQASSDDVMDTMPISFDFSVTMSSVSLLLMANTHGVTVPLVKLTLANAYACFQHDIRRTSIASYADVGLVVYNTAGNPEEVLQEVEFAGTVTTKRKDRVVQATLVAAETAQVRLSYSALVALVDGAQSLEVTMRNAKVVQDLAASKQGALDRAGSFSRSSSSSLSRQSSLHGGDSSDPSNAVELVNELGVPIYVRQVQGDQASQYSVDTVHSRQSLTVSNALVCSRQEAAANARADTIGYGPGRVASTQIFKLLLGAIMGIPKAQEGHSASSNQRLFVCVMDINQFNTQVAVRLSSSAQPIVDGTITWNEAFMLHPAIIRDNPSMDLRLSVCEVGRFDKLSSVVGTLHVSLEEFSGQSMPYPMAWQDRLAVHVQPATPLEASMDPAEDVTCPITLAIAPFEENSVGSYREGTRRPANRTIVSLSPTPEGPWTELSVQKMSLGPTMFPLQAVAGVNSSVIDLLAHMTLLDTGTRRLVLSSDLTVVNATTLTLSVSTAASQRGNYTSSASANLHAAEMAVGTAEEECFENQRWLPLKGFGGTHMLPTERKQFSRRDGARSVSTNPMKTDGWMNSEGDLVALPKGWSWQGDWRIDFRPRKDNAVDDEGWSYAVDFGPGKMRVWPPADGEGKRKPLHFVRRRRWYRVRVYDGQAPSIESSTSSTLHDRAVAGDVVPKDKAPLPINSTGASRQIQVRSEGYLWSVPVDPIAGSASAFDRSQMSNRDKDSLRGLRMEQLTETPVLMACPSEQGGAGTSPMWLIATPSRNIMEGQWTITVEAPLVLVNGIPAPVTLSLMQASDGQELWRDSFAPEERKEVHHADPRMTLQLFFRCGPWVSRANALVDVFEPLSKPKNGKKQDDRGKGKADDMEAMDMEEDTVRKFKVYNIHTQAEAELLIELSSTLNSMVTVMERHRKEGRSSLAATQRVATITSAIVVLSYAQLALNFKIVAGRQSGQGHVVTDECLQGTSDGDANILFCCSESVLPGGSVSESLVLKLALPGSSAWSESIPVVEPGADTSSMSLETEEDWEEVLPALDSSGLPDFHEVEVSGGRLKFRFRVVREFATVANLTSQQILRVFPEVMLENGIGHRCAFRQVNATWSMILEPRAGHRVPIGSWDAGGSKALQMSLVSSGGEIGAWSEPFPISRPCFVDVPGLKDHGAGTSISVVRTNIGVGNDGSRYLHVSPTSLAHANRLENSLPQVVKVRITRNLDATDARGEKIDTTMDEAEWQSVHPHCSTAFSCFAWSGSEFVRKIIELQVGDGYTILEPEAFERPEWDSFVPQVEVAPRVPLRVVSFVEGWTRVVRLLPGSTVLQLRPVVSVQNFNPEYIDYEELDALGFGKSVTLQKGKKPIDASTRHRLSRASVDESGSKELAVKLEQINLEVLVVDHRNKDLLFIAADGISVTYSAVASAQKGLRHPSRFKLTLESMQVDDLREETLHPVVIILRNPAGRGPSMIAQVYVNKSSNVITVFDNIAFGMSEIRLALHYPLITALVGLSKRCVEVLGLEQKGAQSVDPIISLNQLQLGRLVLNGTITYRDFTATAKLRLLEGCNKRNLIGRQSVLIQNHLVKPILSQLRKQWARVGVQALSSTFADSTARVFSSTLRTALRTPIASRIQKNLHVATNLHHQATKNIRSVLQSQKYLGGAVPDTFNIHNYNNNVSKANNSGRFGVVKRLTTIRSSVGMSFEGPAGRLSGSKAAAFSSFSGDDSESSLLSLERPVVGQSAKFGDQLPVPYTLAIARQRNPPTPMPLNAGADGDGVSHAIRDIGQMNALADMILADLNSPHPTRFRICSAENSRGCLHIGGKYVQMKERMERTMQTALVLLPLDQTCTRFWVTSQELYEYNAGRLTFRKDRTVDSYECRRAKTAGSSLWINAWGREKPGAFFVAAEAQADTLGAAALANKLHLRKNGKVDCASPRCEPSSALFIMPWGA